MRTRPRSSREPTCASSAFERRAVDAVFRALPVIVLPGYRRPLVRVSDYLVLLERSTYDENRVR